MRAAGEADSPTIGTKLQPEDPTPLLPPLQYFELHQCLTARPNSTDKVRR